MASFNSNDGDQPLGGLLIDTAGNFYGTTAFGGASIEGVIYELSKGSSTITVLQSFNSADGLLPQSALVMDGTGNLYGTTDVAVFEFSTSELEMVVPAATLTTTSGGSVVLGSGGELTDSAALREGPTRPAPLRLTLYAPNGTTVVDTMTATVNGDGSYTTPNGYTPTQAGIYEWVVSYSGGYNNNPVQSTEGSEPESVSLASRRSTTPGGSVVVGSGGKLTDSATLSGGVNPTGTITFTLLAPDGVTVVDAETVAVNGNNTYTTPSGYIPSATGTYQWVSHLQR